MALFAELFKRMAEGGVQKDNPQVTGSPFMFSVQDNGGVYGGPTTVDLDGNSYQGTTWAGSDIDRGRRLREDLFNARSPAQSLNLLGELQRIAPYETYKSILATLAQKRPELTRNAIRAQQQLHGVGDFSGQEGILARLQRQRGAQLSGGPTLSGGNGLLQSLALNGNQQALNPTVLKAKK